MPRQSPAPAARQLRADAVRNIEAILAATVETMLASNELTMAAVARAAGVSRVTLYAHFPTREALIEACANRALAQTSALLSEVSLDGSTSDGLSRLLSTSWRGLDRFRNLYAIASEELPASQLRALHKPVFGRIENLIARGQAAGEFRGDLPRSWLVATIYALMHQAAEEVNAGRLAAATAGDVVSRTALSILEARPVST